MAEIAALLSFLLNKLDSLFQGERQLLGGLQEQVQLIRTELDHMRAFLSKADATEEIDPQLKVFVKEVREVSYNAEDVIDEFTLRFEHNHGRGLHNILRNISSAIKNLNARRQIASEIQRIRSRVNTWSEKHQTYAINMGNQASSSTTAVDTLHDRREYALLLNENEVVGIEKPKEQLIGWLLESDSKLKVISVVGMGGLGKTTLVKKVYEDTRIKKHFRFRAWVTVSQSLKIDELLKDLIQQHYARSKQAVPRRVKALKNHGLKEMVIKFLQQGSYLLILDDAWSMEAWDSVKHALPLGNGGRVILTTRNANTAPPSSDKFASLNYRLNQLSEEESWKLFCRNAFQDGSCPPHLQQISHSILRKCDGLPLAIVAISAFLNTKGTSQTKEWEMVDSSLGAELRANHEIDFMKEILSLSYNELPDNLKSCFLYLSIFPEDHPIGCKRLIRLWIAERFAEPIEERAMEEVAEGYVHTLLDRNLIQAAGTRSDGRIRACRVHDIMHKISILKSRDKNFAAIAKEQEAPWPNIVRRLSIHNTVPDIQQIKTVSKVRSLFMFGVTDTLSKSFTRILLDENFRMLNVLDLQGAPLESFPDEIVNLIHLRYLSLRDTKVKMIPSSIGKLRNLETLDLKHANVTKLPAGIVKLKQLRHLLVYRYEIESYTQFNYKYGFEGPAKIGKLRSLRKLCFVEASQGSRDLIMELGRLIQLRRLGITKLKREDGKALCSSIEKLHHLRALSVTSFREAEIIDLLCLSSPPPHLERLYLTGCLESLPDWIPMAHNLARLFLKGSQLQADPLEQLQNLPNLVHLELLQVYVGESLCFNAGGFKSLKLLGLDKFEELKSIEVQEGAMPCLEKLIIQRCKLLKTVPSGIEHLTKLKVVEFFDMPDHFIMTLDPENEDGDFPKISHIPEVYSTYWRNQRWDAISLRKSSGGESSSNPSSVITDSQEPRICWK